MWAFREQPSASSRLVDGAWEAWSGVPAGTDKSPELGPDGQSAWIFSPGTAVHFDGTRWGPPIVLDTRYISYGCAGPDQAWAAMDQGQAGAPIVRVHPAVPRVRLTLPAGVANCAVLGDGRLLLYGERAYWRDATGWSQLERLHDIARVDVTTEGFVATGGDRTWRFKGDAAEEVVLPCSGGGAQAAPDGRIRVVCQDHLHLEDDQGPPTHALREVVGLPDAGHTGWALDVDADGLEDVIVQPWDGPARVLLQRDGAFVPAPGWGLPEGEIRWVSSADLDGDGFVEAVTLTATGELTLLRNRRTWFDPMSLPSRSPGRRSGAKPAFVDVDADGDLDLLVGEGGRRDLWDVGWSWRENTWPPTWPERSAPIAYSAGFTRGLEIRDLDQDGREDAIEVNAWGRGLRVLEDWAGDAVDRTAGAGIGGWFADPTYVWFATIGGLPGVLVLDRRRGPRFWRHEAGTLRFRDHTARAGLLPWHDRGTESAVLGLLDADDLPDLVSCHRDHGCLALRGVDSGFEAAGWVLPRGAVGVWRSDLHGDGLPDLVFVRRDAPAVALERLGGVPSRHPVRRRPEWPPQRLKWAPFEEGLALAWCLFPGLLLVGLRADRHGAVRVLPVVAAAMGAVLWVLAPLAGPRWMLVCLVVPGLSGGIVLAELARRARRARTILGRFRLVRAAGAPVLAVPADVLRASHALGEGGSGLVVAAVDAALGHRVAVKALRPGSVEAARALSEVVGKLRNVASPHLVTVLDVHVTLQRAWVVMGLVEGRSLSELIAGGPVPATLALRIVHDVLIGLTALHDAGVVHGDLSTRNVVLGRDGRSVVVDLGLAMRPGEHALGFTPGFGAPGLRAGEPASRGSDVFAVGALWWSLLVGRSPGLDQDLRGLDPVLTRATSRDASERPASAAAMRALLAEPKATHGEVARLLDRAPLPGAPRPTETWTWS